MIRLPRFAIPLIASCLALVVPTVSAQPGFHLCGGAQGKAYAALNKSFYLEAAKLCTKGDADGVGPAASTYSPAARITAKFVVAVGKAMDKYGAFECNFLFDSQESNAGFALTEYTELAWDDQQDMDSNDDPGYCPHDNVGGVGVPARNDCGASQLKLSGILLDGIIKEASRACAQGDPAFINPGPIDEEKIESVVTKFVKGTNRSIDKYGTANCAANNTPIAEADIPALTAAFSALADGIADELCSGQFF